MLLIFSGLLIPFFSGFRRTLFICIIPLISLFIVWNLSFGSSCTVSYLGYELISQIETKIISHEHRYNFPVAFATRIPAAIIKDNFNNETFIICEKKYYSMPTLSRSPMTTTNNIKTSSAYNLENKNKFITFLKKFNKNN